MKFPLAALALLGLCSCRSFHEAEARVVYTAYGEADFTADGADGAVDVSTVELGFLAGDGEDGRLVGFAGDIALRGATESQTFDGIGAELHQLGLRTGVRYYYDTKTARLQPYLGVGLLLQQVWARSSTLGVEADDSAFGLVTMVGIESLLGAGMRLGLGCQVTLGLEPEVEVYTFDFDAVTPVVSLGVSF
ncbi:MAG: hypothetical protein QF903_15730 [Planctomycetota bacterium]|jgi:hypothetical protein|nr:hypothetical protein [Planctomycetota bacterium]MDP6763646.1 hypothetical protein [Planctomycetota bacterium]MDP6990919.1 hypothetical protein [Planctomycetota bacterium]